MEGINIPKDSCLSFAQIFLENGDLLKNFNDKKKRSVIHPAAKGRAPVERRVRVRPQVRAGRGRPTPRERWKSKAHILYALNVHSNPQSQESYWWSLASEERSNEWIVCIYPYSAISEPAVIRIACGCTVPVLEHILDPNARVDCRCVESRFLFFSFQFFIFFIWISRLLASVLLCSLLYKKYERIGLKRPQPDYRPGNWERR